MDSDRDKLKKILLFQLNKNIIGFAKEMILILEQSKIDRDLFISHRKFIFDSSNQTIRDLTEIIEQAF